MGRVKWNVTPNANTNMNNVQKVPPRNLQNFMPGKGYMRRPWDGIDWGMHQAAVNSQPPASTEDVSCYQPGKMSREGNFDYANPPNPAGDTQATNVDGVGRSPWGWPQAKENLGAISHPRIQSNLTDLPSKSSRKYTAQG